MEASPNYRTNERLFFEFQGFKNGIPYSGIYLSINNTKNEILGKYDGSSYIIKQNNCYDVYLLSLST